MTTPTEGQTRTIERTFTREDVEQFAAVSGDDQSRHTEPDEDGRVMVQGLLTATLPTSIGSDNEVLASLMEFRFRRPVYTGETITCHSTYESVTEREDDYVFTSELVCENEAGETVLTGTVEGMMPKD
ncbi:MaoC family dehydratase [Halovenus halobia]|uniref:MaoC family dehydratase n=1 Tax=Halovenus halobia TaxID=3396622 RepID=UPI003F550AA7